MNWVVIKDLKVALGFSLAFIAGIAAILLAIGDNDFFVVLLLFAQAFTILSVGRASKLTTIDKSNTR
ncbi:hypothetical protein [Halobacillus salinus]|uniref:Uncharacterized protein n=1 Tax=Halobacillus salinus TaxID=192814 RepID=A0A4Z0H2U2_9BACI|nr:hypothetical protein [Halobacillus salinus]TGB03726.1 hypothetical protein E4663_01605 [Halobacillus salinus]